jgi:hypothetical protein
MCNKKSLLEWINNMSDEQINVIEFIIGLPNKDFGDLMKFCGKYDGVDSARPQGWSDKMRDEMNFNPVGFVWSYQKEDNAGGCGKPVNLFAEFYNKLYNSF